MTPDDQRAAFAQQMDQAGASMRDLAMNLAAATAAFATVLKERGVDTDLIAPFTLEYLSMTLHKLYWMDSPPTCGG